MRVTLDHSPLPITGTSVDDALDAAARMAESARRVIIEVIVDGEPWSEDELASAERRAAEASEVELLSADLIELVVQTLEDASAELTVADRLQREAAEAIQSDQTRAGYEALGQAIGIWQQVGQAVERSGQALGLDLDTVQIDGDTVDATIQQLDDQLRLLRAALQEEDPVTLADSLLYEFPTVVTRWRELLAGLVTEIRKGNP